MEETNNEIWVTKFDEEHALKFRAQIQSISKGDPSRPIIIYIDSYGGYVDALAKMIETLEETPNPIITSVVGKAMSCGAMLLSHGDVRFLGPNSRIMVHEVSSGTIGNVQDMKEDVKETVRLNEHFMGILAKNCGFKNYEELRKVLKTHDGRDYFISGKEAIDFGIVDVIGLPRVTSKTIYEVSRQPTKKPLQPRKKQVSGKSGRKSPKKSETKKQ